MERRLVTSSVLRSVGYDSATRTLEVEFLRDGDVYHYFPVPESLYRSLMSASSVGLFFDENIWHRFIYRKIGP